jgi:predicted GNAT family acetyltransferase
MGALCVEAVCDPAALMERAGAYLLADPVGLNVIWSVLRQRADSGSPGRYWLLESGGSAAGIVLESPPGHAAAISPLSAEHAVAMARAISASGHHLAGLAGEAYAAASFAGSWSEETETSAAVEAAQRLYELGCLVQPEKVPGRLRRVEFFERSLIVEWWSAFQVETGSSRYDVSVAVDLALSAGRLFVWDDDGARCVARATEPLGGISRIGAVFTPPRWRRHGYAAACVGALSAWVRDEEGANSILYAQLANPSSNAIYRRLGFRAVAEMLSYRFGDLARHR